MPATQRRDAAATRQRILDAARHRFGRDGFSATTTRLVAGDAGVDAALVHRYFGTKDGLWDAATEVQLDLPDFSTTPRTRLGRAVLEVFLDRWEGDQAPALLTLLSASTTDERAAATVAAVFGEQVRPALARVAEEPAAERRTALVVTTLLGLALCRYLLRLPAVCDLDRDAVVALYGPLVQRALTGAVPA